MTLMEINQNQQELRQLEKEIRRVQYIESLKAKHGVGTTEDDMPVIAQKINELEASKPRE